MAQQIQELATPRLLQAALILPGSVFSASVDIPGPTKPLETFVLTGAQMWAYYPLPGAEPEQADPIVFGISIVPSTQNPINETADGYSQAPDVSGRGILIPQQFSSNALVAGDYRYITAWGPAQSAIQIPYNYKLRAYISLLAGNTGVGFPAGANLYLQALVRDLAICCQN
jgi:hypothetical protein